MLLIQGSCIQPAATAYPLQYMHCHLLLLLMHCSTPAACCYLQLAVPHTYSLLLLLMHRSLLLIHCSPGGGCVVAGKGGMGRRKGG
ncbi:hypothetical protein, partial [Neoaquamicrobium sediminum]|uniref:hypothetical protein n=1 Tax=Neoaquamicrobium sediminum TaxID=1849104 RepID=UPI004035B361